MFTRSFVVIASHYTRIYDIITYHCRSARLRIGYARITGTYTPQPIKRDVRARTYTIWFLQHYGRGIGYGGIRAVRGYGELDNDLRRSRRNFSSILTDGLFSSPVEK